MRKVTCPCCAHQFELETTKKKPVQQSDGYISKPLPSGGFVWIKPDGIRFKVSFPHDQKRYEKIIAKHKDAAFTQMRKGAGNYYGHTPSGESFRADVPYIDSGYLVENARESDLCK